MEQKKYKYSVALSFSGKQRSYVERVSKELTRLNIRHFYDFNEQEELWGKDLARYLDKLYFEDAEYFVPFISKEYVETVWPNHELSAALDRNKSDLRPDYQRYILPVYFDDIRVNGIPRSIGYYDAHKVSPESLANAIYKKVYMSNNEVRSIDSNDKTVNISSDSARAYSGIHINLIETVNEAHKDRIYVACTKEQNSCIIVVYGERGLGKRSCISRALLKLKSKSIFHIHPFHENQYKYDSIIQSFGLDDGNLSSDCDLDFESNIKRRIISKIADKPSVIYIEHFHKFDEESRRLLYELSESLIVRQIEKDIRFIFEFDSDVDSNLILPFYELIPNKTELIPFERLPLEEITACFYNYCGNILISEKNLSYIIRSSLGNIMYLNVIVNYLQGTGYINEIDGRLICNCLPDGALSDVLKKYLLQRYERLDGDLRELLSKSATIGTTFNVTLLEKPFQIINAAEKLTNIEKISNLIECCNNKTYIFETEDVYNLIRSNISKEQQKEWHNLLAHYFLRLLKRETKYKNTLTAQKTISLIYPVAKHFKYATEYQEALPYYLKLISLYSQISDYYNGLRIVKDIQLIIDYIELDENELERIEIVTMMYQANCYKGIGRYEEALEVYDDLLSLTDDSVYSQNLISISYNKAFCLYMTGKILEAQDILLSVCERLQLRKNHKKDYVRIISLLASICDSTNDSITQRQLYLESLTFYRENHFEFEYYELLKMASMVFDETIALEMELEAERFFRNNQNIRNLAETLHNIATTELYLENTANIKSHINECISLFDAFGSKAVHYPLNTKGIFEMVVDQNYQEAISTFTAALSSSTEVYSEIAIRTNIIQCLIQLKDFDEAQQQILLVDKMIAAEPQGIVPVYETFHLLNWAIFFLHRNLPIKVKS